MRSKVAKVGAMLGHFSVLGAIFRVLGVLGHFVGEFGASSSFWGRLGPSRARVWKVLGRAGGGFGRLGSLFSLFFVLLRLVCVKASTFTKHWQEQ